MDEQVDNKGKECVVPLLANLFYTVISNLDVRLKYRKHQNFFVRSYNFLFKFMNTLSLGLKKSTNGAAI